MQADNLLCQSKADTRFSFFPHIEAIKDMGKVLLGNAVSIVLYPDHHIPFVGPAGQAQLAAGIPQTVGQDIRDRPAYLRVIAFDHDGLFGKIRYNDDSAM